MWLQDTLSSPLIRSTALRQGGSWTYGRITNPTVDAVAGQVAELEGAAAGVLVSSGTAAIVCALLSTTPPGCTVVAASEVCSDAHRVLTRLLPELGRPVRFVPVADLDGWDVALAHPGALTAYCESVANPTLAVADVDQIAAVARRRGARLVVDATVATPLGQRALELGAELVVHSASKYLNGHSDVIAGVVCGSQAAIDGVREAQTALGAAVDPAAAALLERGMKTLEVRTQRQSQTARELAAQLSASGQVEWARTASHRLLSQTPGLVALRPSAPWDLSRCRHIREAPTFGGTETLAYQPHGDPHADSDWLEGVEPGLVRLAVGLEAPELIAADLLRAAVAEDVAV